jgi:histidyl-tRNA synthetase
MFTTPRGTQDILPDDWPYWNFVLGHAHEVAHLFGYRRIETPTFAETGLFARTSGLGSDVVDKEMYTFRDRGGDELTLRPEGTAPVMRAYLQHGMNKLPQPVKLYYIERMYRYDRPQRGRLREHHQFGCEGIGVEDAFLDVEIIALLHELYRRIGLADVSLHLNSIGDEQCRPAYVADLVSYLQAHEERLASRDRDRLARNPLRVLDSKESVTQPLLEGAPRILDYLCEDCRAHWQKLRHGLDLLGLVYTVDHRLVRGLDYYTRTAFEFMPPSEGAQSTIGGGGRYDALSLAMGGPPTPGIGFGTGIERLVLNVKERGIEAPVGPHPDVYIARQGQGTEDGALLLARRLRGAGIPVSMAFGDRSLKAQMRHANSSGSRYAAILGDQEVAEHRVTVRSLETGEQRSVPEDEVASAVRGTTEDRESGS